MAFVLTKPLKKRCNSFLEVRAMSIPPTTIRDIVKKKMVLFFETMDLLIILFTKILKNGFEDSIAKKECYQVDEMFFTIAENKKG